MAVTQRATCLTCLNRIRAPYVRYSQRITRGAAYVKICNYCNCTIGVSYALPSSAS